MASQKLEGEEEALFHSYPCPIYYVQSPFSASHANSSDCGHPDSALLSPFPHDAFAVVPAAADANRPSCQDAASRFTLSRYSSSRGSNNSFLHEKKIVYDLGSQLDEAGREGAEGGGGGRRRQRLRVEGLVGEEEVEGGGGEKSGVWRFLALDPSASCCCISVQVAWRFMVSVGVALLLFFLATKPPSPSISVQITGVKQFLLGEGLDNTGVSTKVLTCNCSIDMPIENHSKVFGLHIRPTAMEIAFDRLVLAKSQGDAAYVGSSSSSTLRLFVGTAHRPVYGAGRAMQDLLESGSGLPLVVRLRSASRFRVVWGLIQQKYRHHAECLLVLDGTYDERHHSQTYNTTCSAATFRA
ncbi:hypothetical protein Taro_055146 [Colocasia esculenta]|uniref:Uncharacterized protein n=1 Tax=Colocasia esculenta TaxID=4460 RepID=A0A843XTD2_COLES|nr:hypothetical protein [Colocasia esculenta]